MNKKAWLILGGIFAGLILLCGCCFGIAAISGYLIGPSNDQSDLDYLQFKDTDWRVTYLEGVELDSSISSIQASLEFELLSVKLDARCNTIQGVYNVRGNKLTVKDIIATEMYCEEVAQIEAALIKNIGNTVRFDRTGNTLKLYDKDNQKVLEAELSPK
jgi:heat shock protein HslJ